MTVIKNILTCYSFKLICTTFLNSVLYKILKTTPCIHTFTHLQNVCKIINNRLKLLQIEKYICLRGGNRMDKNPPPPSIAQEVLLNIIKTK